MNAELKKLVEMWERVATRRREYRDDELDAVRRRILLRCADELRAELRALADKPEVVH